MSDVLMVSPARLGESARPGETGTCSHEGTPVRMPSSQICFPTLVVKSFSVWSHAKWVWQKRCSLKRLGACGILPTTRCSCSRRQHQTEQLQIRLAALKKKTIPALARPDPCTGTKTRARGIRAMGRWIRNPRIRAHPLQTFQALRGSALGHQGTRVLTVRSR